MTTKRRARRKPDTSDAVTREALIKTMMLHDHFYGRAKDEEDYRQASKPRSARNDAARGGGAG